MHNRCDSKINASTAALHQASETSNPFCRFADVFRKPREQQQQPFLFRGRSSSSSSSEEFHSFRSRKETRVEGHYEEGFQLRKMLEDARRGPLRRRCRYTSRISSAKPQSLITGPRGFRPHRSRQLLLWRSNVPIWRRELCIGHNPRSSNSEAIVCLRDLRKACKTPLIIYDRFSLETRQHYETKPRN